MKTVVLASCTPEEKAMLAERRRLDQDRLDEIWQGEYHMNPGPHVRHALLCADLLTVLKPYATEHGLRAVVEFNVGEANDLRVPDLGLLRPDHPDAVYLPTAALVVEVASPGDESWLKFDFYAAHDVDEVVIVEGKDQALHWFALRGDTYEPVERSALLDLDVAEVTAAIEW